MGFGGSGGSGSSIAGATDTTLNNPTNNQVLSYDGPTSMWRNAAGGGGVQSVNGQQGAVTLNAGQVGAVATTSPGMQISYGTLANRPAAGQAGRFYIVIPG